MTPEERAAQSILMLIASTAADTAGANYSPCLRDCVHDARGWVGPLIAQALIARSNDAIEEAAKIADARGKRARFEIEISSEIATAIRNLKTKEG